jgi:hypothetical protein
LKNLTEDSILGHKQDAYSIKTIVKINSTYLKYSIFNFKLQSKIYFGNFVFGIKQSKTMLFAILSFYVPFFLTASN